MHSSFYSNFKYCYCFYYHNYYVTPWQFFKQVLANKFYWSPSDCKSLNVSRTLTSILSDLNNALVLDGPFMSSDSQTYTSEFESHWVPHSFGLVPHRSKELCKLLFYNRDIGPAVRVFANGPGDLGSIPGRVIPKTLKMELDTTLLNTQHYKVRLKGKVEQSREWSSALPYTLV